MCWSLYIWTKILISYIDLEKEDVKSAEEVILISLTGPLAWHQPCHTCAWQRTHISYNYVRKSSWKLNFFLTGPVSTLDLDQRQMTVKKFTPFNGVVGSFSLNGTSFL